MNSPENTIENPLFLKWIFHSSPEIESYWEEYLENHPLEAQHLLEIKAKLKNVRLKTEALSEEEKLKLAHSIHKKLEKEEKRVKTLRRIGAFIRYAAVAVLFFCSGALVVYLTMGDRELDKYLGNMDAQFNSDSPVLIVSEGKQIPIQSGESTLDYRNPGEIILNEDSIIKTITPSRISQLVIPYGSSSKIVLSDNSVVWLNAGSSLIYPSVFEGKSREVVLFGEAYFNVSRDDHKPFFVRTTALEIQVLGTEFNVMAYPEDNIIQTVLKEGRVTVRRIDDSGNESEVILKPNQLASYDKNTRKSNISTVDTEFYTLWTDGLLSFENLDMNRIVKKVERFYNISIRFKDPMLGSIRISGKLDLKQGKHEVFEYLSKVSNTIFDELDEKHYTIR